MNFKLLAIGFFLGLSLSFDEEQLLNFLDRTGGGVLERNRLEKKDKSIVGTPYSVEKFMPADIEGAGEIVLVRYNNQADEIEIEYSDKILILPRKSEYEKISLRNGKVIKLLNYVDARNASIYGYLYELYVGKKITLYLKERSVIIPEKESQNGYDAPSPARYSRTSDEYYFKHKDNIVEFPSKKKDLIALYPENKKQIEDFIKVNKIKFKTEDDFVKLATFIDGL